MKKTTLITICLLLLSISVQAVDWSDRLGVGLRGPAYVPLFEGSDFKLYGEKIEPYSVGWNVEAHGRLGLTERIVLNLSLGYVSAYDDTLATEDQSFYFNGPGSALSRLEGLQYRFVADYFFMKDKNTQPYFIVGPTVNHWRVNRRRVEGSQDPYIGTVVDFSLAYGFGVNFWLMEHLTLDVQALFNHGLFNIHTDMPEGAYGPGDWSSWSDRPFRAALEPSLGLTYWFGGGSDSDNDGVNDDKDECPNTPVGAIVNAVGCPLDSDGDGVYNGLDACPNTPGGARVNAQGCPIDSDNDRVFDGIDRCPGTPAGVAVDKFGCPLDDDNDGVPNFKDNCPDTPAGAPVDSVGCPLDSDNDGVPDYGDNCPGTAPNLAVDNEGCPLLQEALTLSERVLYPFDSYVIRPTARPVLDSVMTVLKAYPQVKVEIRGYTDAIGPESYNQTLSMHRANSVKQYLLDKGIAADRMRIQGFGEAPEHFIADNSTAVGRQENRRVEIEFVRELQ